MSGDRINPIDAKLLNKIIEDNRPKLIATKVEGGIPIKVYEPKPAANVFASWQAPVRGLNYD